MQSKWMRRLGLAALLAGVGYASVGCAEERDPRDFRQPNALPKSFFVGTNLRDASDDPEFYMRNTIVEVPYGAGLDGLFPATYAQPLNRIKWEIVEDKLIARMTHERIQNSDHKGSKRTNDGTVVAMFAIESQFDVKRAYNPGTGEELNIIEENTSDRPWYDREYIRVDWSRNMVTDGYQVDTLSQLGAFGSVKYSPVAYHVADPNDPNRPLFDTDEGYFDVTQKVFASPELWDTPWGRLPACFWSSPVANCNPTEVTLRLSFKKVVDRDYEPVEWNGKQMEAFGAFLEERFSYDRNFGLVDQNWHRFAALHNVWEKSHIEGSQCGVDFWRDEKGEIAKYKAGPDGTLATDPKTGMPIPDPKGQPKAGTPVGVDPKRDTKTVAEGARNRILTPDDGWGTEDDCEFRDGGGQLLHKGAYCDLATKKCALPRYERKIRTIPWYFGPEDKNDLFPSTARALNDWNIAVKYALVLGMKAEAERVGVRFVAAALGTDTARISAILEDLDEDKIREDKASAERERRVPAIADVFVMCHNPTVETDHPSCFKKGADGALKPIFGRIGDIRYNFVNLIEGPHSGGPWGIMVDAVDPLTGEKVAASVNEWVPILDLVVQSNMDIMRWVNGEITDEQVSSGKYLRDWVSASKLGAAQHLPKTLTKADIETRSRSIDKTIMSMNGLTPADKALPGPVRRQKANEHLAKTLGASVTPEIAAARQKLIGSRWEAAMITPEMMQFAGLPANAPVADEQTLNMASPLRTMHPTFHKWMERQRALGLANNHACIIEQPEPNGIVGLARMALRDYPLPDPNKAGACAYDPALDQKADYPACRALRDKRLHQWMREQFHYAVISHEMGHSMTLRHNFTGSADPFNYHQEYWQLRTRNGEERVCEDSVTPHTDGKECVGPRWIDPVTDDEVNGIIWKFANTTVMDYPGDPTGDMIGLGAYDKAAMRFIYGNVADVEEDAIVGTDKGDAYVGALDGTYYMGVSVGDKHYSKLNDAFKLIDNTGDRKCVPTKPNPTSPVDYKCPRYSKTPGKRLIHPSLKDMATRAKYGEEVLKLRPDLVSNFAVYTGLPAWGELEDPKKAPRAMARHPYTFSSDEYADIGNIPVYRHDGGADPYEMMQFLITSYENRYIFDNFRRDRAAFSPRSAGSRAIDRYFDKIHGMSKSFFLAASNAQNSSEFENADSLQAISLATTDAFDMFARVMTRPEPGTYVIDKTGKTPTARALTAGEVKDNPTGDFSIAAGSGEGRFINNDYDYSKGELWYQYPLVAGSWLEKTYAMYYLLEAENNYVSNSKEDYIDGRYKNTNFTNVFPNQVRRLMSQLFQGDITTLGPYVGTGTGTLSTNKVARVQYLPWYAWDEAQPTTTTLDYPAGSVVLNPLYGWNQQMYGMLNAFIFGATKLTMDTTAQLRIFSTGDGATVSLLPNEQVRYTDPLSSITYVAKFFGTERINTRNAPVMRTPGARMLQFANELAEATFETTAKDPVTGELTFVKDAGGNPVCKVAATCTAQTAKLKSYSSNIDTVRQLSLFYGYGPL